MISGLRSLYTLSELPSCLLCDLCFNKVFAFSSLANCGQTQRVAVDRCQTAMGWSIDKLRRHH